MTPIGTTFAQVSVRIKRNMDFQKLRLKALHYFVAAIVRKVYLRPGTGVGALTKRFGGAYR